MKTLTEIANQFNNEREWRKYKNEDNYKRLNRLINEVEFTVKDPKLSDEMKEEKIKSLTDKIKLIQDQLPPKIHEELS